MIRTPAVFLLFPLLLFIHTCSPRQQSLGKVYRVSLSESIKGFDPAHTDDRGSVIAVKQIYETLLQYHYLKRPYTLTPLLADTLPLISEDGLTYTFRLKKNVFFQDDPCFQGNKRRLVAEDFIFSIKRLADIRVKSTGWWIFDGRVAGLNEFRDKSTQVKKTDYALPVPGLSAPDTHTLVITLTSPCPQFNYFFAMPFTSPVAREAVDYYGEEFLNHPVGTGPFRLAEWRRNLRLTFVKSPDFREERYPSDGSPGDLEAGLLSDAGKRLPLVDSVIFSEFVESEPMWLNFIRGRLDISGIPKDNFQKAINADLTLKENFIEKGIQLAIHPMLDLTYTPFNMEHPILGQNVHLRRALCHAWDVKKVIELFYNGRAILAHTPIPPGLLGYDSTFVNPYQKFDTLLAKKELALAGFPGGKGLPVFRYLTTDGTVSRQWAEKFTKEMSDVGIKIEADMVTWPEFLKRLKTKSYDIAGAAWGADYPDPENFLQLLYGPNESPGTNSANFKNSEYDSLYRSLLLAKNEEEKLKIIRRMREIFIEQTPWIIDTHRLSFGLRYSWVKNLKYNDVSEGNYKYVRMDVEARNQKLSQYQ